MLSAWWNQMRIRMRVLRDHGQLDRDLQDEVDFHLAMREESHRASGMAEAEAHRSTRLQFGNTETVKGRCRELWTWNRLETLWRDLRYGGRILRKNLFFTTVAVLTLALGIGSNTAIFSLVDSVLLKPLPYPQANQLVVLHERIRRPGYERDQETITPGDFTDWKKRNSAFRDMAAIASRSFGMSGTGEAVQIDGEAVSANLFSMLQVGPVVGRVFHPGEDQYGAGKVAILGYGLWTSRFAADPQVVGRTVLLDGTNYVVVGVMPKWFSFPDPDDQLWVPLAISAQEAMSRAVHSWRVVARLKEGTTPAQAETQMNSLSAELAYEHPDTNSGLSASFLSLREQTVGNVRPALLILWLCTSLVLLIVCVNLASLLLTRASIRRREFAVRLALGATRSRIVFQLVIEGLLLSFLGGAAGLLFAIWGMHALRRISPPPSFPYIPRIEEIGINGTLLIFVLGLSLLAGIMFSLIPALRTAAHDIQKTLKEEDSRGNSGGPGRWVRSTLVVMQTALGVVVMIGAGLLLRSFVRLGHVSLGFEPENVLTMRVLPRGIQYPGFPERLRFYPQVLDKVQNVPGVESAGAVSFLPLTRTRHFDTFWIEGQALTSGSWSPSADIRAVTPGYLEAMKIALTAGRKFSWEDTPESAPVVIVSKKFVQDFFSQVGPIGAHLKIGNLTSSNGWRTIVGVVDDVPYFDITSPPQPTIYVPYSQTADLHMDLHDLALRTSQSPASVAEAIRNEILGVDRNLAVSRVRTMEDVYSISVAPQRFNLLLLALMAGLVLLLAAIGLYGVAASSVVQRTREIGVRLVLGATPAHIFRLILVHSGALVLYGVVTGIVLSLSLTSLINSLLFNVSPLDFVTYGLVAILLSLVGLLACYGPARTAMRVDPITALHYE